MTLFPFSFALPDNILIKRDQVINLTYYVDQTYNYYDDPQDYREARTTILGNLTHNNNEAGWDTEILYQAKLRAGTCYDINRFDARFEYTFSNSTRHIQTVKSSHDDWDIKNKHPAFYCGKNPGEKEEFLIDEMMFILGEYGILERSFSYITDKMIEISNKEYKTHLFQVSSYFQRREQV